MFFVVRTATGQERTVSELIASRSKTMKTKISSIMSPTALKGYIIVERVKIKDGATIGMKATVMGDVEIGEGAVITPHEVVLPKSRIPAGRKPGESY